MASGEERRRTSSRDNNRPWEELCIYKVPGWLKDDQYYLKGDGSSYHANNYNSSSAYTPEIVSIGPMYHGREHLRPMEKHKTRIFDHMLKRENQTQWQYFEKIKELKQTLFACYEDPQDEWHSEFIEMLVRDGCFLLEFLRGYKLGYNYLGYDQYYDPVFSKDYIRHIIGRDMIKLENQIPLIVLEKLLELQYNREISPDELPSLLLHVLAPITWLSSTVKVRNRGVCEVEPPPWIQEARERPHCLDIFRLGLINESDPSADQVIPIEASVNERACIPATLVGKVSCLYRWYQRPRIESNNQNDKTELMVGCATELKKAGIKFRSKRGGPYWDISFDKKRGLLEIPSIKINYTTKTVFLNLIAYEQRHFNNSWEMITTDYVSFMDNLIDSAEDVGYLRQSGIIVHQLGSDTEVADLFNHLIKGGFLDKNQGVYSNQYKELNKYCSHKKNYWRAILQHDHLRDPWVIISIIFVILLFLITLIQTVYAVVSYHLPDSSESGPA